MLEIKIDKDGTPMIRLPASHSIRSPKTITIFLINEKEENKSLGSDIADFFNDLFGI